MDEQADEQIVTSDKNKKYVFRLFIIGASPNSVLAVKNLKHLCDTYVPGEYRLDIIDVYQQPELAQPEQLVALPVLVKQWPLPEQRLIGDLSDTKRVLAGLGLTEKNR